MVGIPFRTNQSDPKSGMKLVMILKARIFEALRLLNLSFFLSNDLRV